MCVKICTTVTAFLVFLAVLRLASGQPARFVLKQYEEFTGLLKEKQKESSWYQSTLLRLERNGARFHYGEWVNPQRYLVMKTLLALVAMMIVGRIFAGLWIIAGGILFFLPDILLTYLNSRDNVRMLPEVKLIYHALEIQIKAGVYVTDALAECYSNVRERRLQQALLDLAGQIVMKADIYEALDQFQKKFDNRHIDALCITLLQACESGQAVELLRDIGEQLKDVETAVMNSRKNSLDRSITFYQLGMLTALLAVVIYACVSYLFSAVVQL